VAFGAGGRRRSEVVQLKMEDIVERTERFCIVEIRGAKNQTYADEVLTVKIEGKAKRYLDDWLRVSGITSGFVFRQLKPRSHAVKKMASQARNCTVSSKSALLSPAWRAPSTLRPTLFDPGLSPSKASVTKIFTMVWPLLATNPGPSTSSTTKPALLKITARPILNNRHLRH